MEQICNYKVKSSKHNRPILTDVFYEKNNLRKPVIIFCHGYKGYKDWGAWNLAGEAFSMQGIFFVKFNFSHNGGTPEQPIDFPDLKAFGKNNYSIEISDLNDIIHWLVNHPGYASEIDTSNITLIGHSRGGGIAALVAESNEHVNRLISWAGVSDFGDRFPKGEELETWRTNGVSYIINTRTNQEMPHLYQFFEDYQKNKDTLDIKRAVSALKIPHLIVQGSEDQAVKLTEAKNLNAWNPTSKLVVIEGMNHPLGCTQPWTKKVMPTHLCRVVQISLDFILHGSPENQ
jgi:pimeloyl-ACP methyl ester carboxylesterase